MLSIVFTLLRYLFFYSPQRDDIDFWPCTESEGEHDGTDAIADVEDLVAFGVT